MNVNSKGLGSVEANINLNLKNILSDTTEDNENIDIFKSHTCEYFEPQEIQKLHVKESFSIYSHNVRSLSGHFDNFRDLLYTMLPVNFSYIGLQEIWSINKQYDLPGYTKLEYKSRDMNTVPNPNCGGGVGFYLSNQYPDYEILEEESIFIPGLYESIWVKIKISQGKFKIIGNVYRPNTVPRANLKIAISTHSNVISSILSNKKHKNCSIEIISDFNIDILQFEQHSDTKHYLETMASFGFLPVITRPTRITQTSATLIDHIFVLNKSTQHTAGIIINSLSDHYPTFYLDKCKTQKQKLTPYRARIINEKTIPAFSKLLKETAWQDVLLDTEPESAFNSFFSKIDAARDLAFPEILIKPRKNQIIHNVWMTPGLLISCKTKSKLFSQKIKNPTLENQLKFKTFNSIYNKLRRAAKKLYYFDSFTECKDNLRQTWNLIREVSHSKKKQKDSLPDWFRADGNIIRDSQEISNQFNSFISNAGPNLASKIPESTISFTHFLGKPNQANFQFSFVSEITILDYVKRMKSKWSCGVDGISNNLLKVIIPFILLPLKHLINLSLQTGYVPPQVGKIVPIFKDTDCHDFNFYRPICLLTSVWKLVEQIVCFQLIGFLDRYDLLYKHQYGFRAKHNTSQPLLHFTERVFQALNDNKFNISIFIDLKKAFETVNFEILLSKMKHYGVKNTELLWFKNYLTNRSQFCTVHGKDSVKCKVKCGIPQGSVAGPLLFLIFINDLPNASDFFTILFADDCTFQLSGSDPNFLIDRANSELSKAQTWFQANKLTLNIKKTRYILFKNKDTHVHFSDVMIGDNVIDRVGDSCKEKSFKFLGHWVDEHLSWKQHLDKLQRKLISANYALSSCKYSVPLRICKIIYKSLFESHLNFGSIIYGSCNPNLLTNITNLQKRAIRSVACAKFAAHTDPLFQRFNVLKVTDIVRLNQCLLIHKFRANRLPPTFNSFFKPMSSGPSSSIKDSDYNYKHNNVNRDYLCYYPHYQAVKAWNCTNIDIKCQGEEELFKQRFISSKVFSYESECLKRNCYSCK